MPRWMKSVSVWAGLAATVLAPLAVAGLVAPPLAAGIAIAVTILQAVARFRPGAGESITNGQAVSPN